jgi:membrane-bound lytic murein transglycosylase D
MLARKRSILIVILTLLLTAPFYRSVVRAESDPLPVYPCLQPNIDFWLKIYTEYSSNYGVIHDKREMNRIYDVIELVDPDHHGGQKINKQRINEAKKKYRRILGKLMRGKDPAGPVEHKVAEFFRSDAKAADFRSAMRNIRCQTGQKDRFRAGVIRSGAYIDEIKRIFRNEGLPEDLSYLPHVESSFNPKAYSKFGAAGIWQFTRSTGKHFMEVGYTIDERRDPMLSSSAAAKLLRQNFRKLKNWPMAITAYNHGTSGMLRAKRLRGTYEAIFKSYRSRIFRFASRNFYSEFLAAREAAKNYRLYFGDLKLDSPDRSREIVLAGYVSLPEMARHLKIDLSDLGKLNPALRPPVFRGQKYVPAGYHLRLPDRSNDDWQILNARLPEELYRSNQKHSHIYKVRRGDTAGMIARNHGVKLSDLIAANNLNARATIYVDQHIKIPLSDEKAIQLAKNQPVTKASTPDVGGRDRKKPGTLLPAASRSSSPDLAQRAKDSRGQAKRSTDAQNTPLQIAELEHSITMEEKLKTAPPRPLDLWQFKQVFPPPQLNPTSVQAHLAVKPVAKQNGKPVGAIRVEVGETLGHYAEWLGVPAKELRQLNGFRYGRALKLNQQIKIPLHRVTIEEFEEKRLEYHQELAEDFFASYRVEKLRTYSIKRGDTIWSLSRQEFEVPLWLIKRYNTDVDFNTLMPSQKLLIPVIEKNV